MPACQYCLEEIKPGATKCPHCQSDLTPASKTPQKSGEVTYVLDRGLVRFGKFALAVLALFVVVGTYVFGLDLKDLVKRMEATEERMHQLDANLNAAQQEIEEKRADLLKTVENAREQEEILEQHRDRVAVVVAYIQKQEAYVRALVSQPKQLTPTQEAKRQEESASAIARAGTKLWQNGATIAVAFLDGTPEQRESVKQIATTWTEYANITFAYITDPASAQIRVSFQNLGSWSFLGTDALGIPSNHATVNLDLFDPNQRGSRAMVLQEFGHVLGLVNETANPVNGIRWHEDKVIADLSDMFWDEKTIRYTLLAKYSKQQYPGSRPFDPDSIMIPGIIKPEWHEGDTKIGPNYSLSESDKTYIASLYPKQ